MQVWRVEPLLSPLEPRCRGLRIVLTACFFDLPASVWALGHAELKVLAYATSGLAIPDATLPLCYSTWLATWYLDLSRLDCENGWQWQIALVRGLSSKALNIDVIAYVLPAVVKGLK
jgi:hypothetical protein